jgi:large subunit ribosomal protein L9
MRVVFLKDVPNVARAGDTREVADGYAKNYLFPKKLALQLKAGVANQVEVMNRVKAHQNDEVVVLAQRLESIEVNLKAKAGEQERLYGSVTSADIAAELGNMGISVDKRKIEMAEPFHQLGSYEVTIRLGKDVTPKIKVIIVEDKTAAAEEKPVKEKKKATKKEGKPAEAAVSEAEKKKRAPRAKKPVEEGAPKEEKKAEKKVKKAAEAKKVEKETT